jgi:large subunit ribosomal protein L25
MKKDITITAEPREGRGKNEARRLRVKGFAPAVVYGAEKDAVAVAVNPKDVQKVLRSGHNTIFTLAIRDGETTPAMLVDWQHDPVKEYLLHVDLKRIDPSKRLAVKIPVHVHGEAKGVKLQGGLLEVITREIEIDCLPDEIPDEFTVDVAELSIGQNVRASDIQLSGSMKLLSSGELVIAHVVSLKAEEVPAEVAAVPGVGEPEVIKKGKKDEAAAPPEKGGKAAAPATKTAAPTKQAAPPAKKK